MRITRKAWEAYVYKLRKISDAAADAMWQWLRQNGTDSVEAAVLYARTLSGTYGEAAGALACEMYDGIAAAYGVTVPAAEPAEVDYGAAEAAARAVLLKNPSMLPAVVAREVKQVSADTMLRNAARDGAEFAWIPSGDTCAFCITLASRGWQRQSKKAAQRHAPHIHTNCDCNYSVRFGNGGGVGGYDPDKYLEQYQNADGSTPQARINAMRREQYAQNAEEINARKRINYADRKARKAAEEAET